MTLTAVFLASLIGSLHCAAMCGGFSLYCSAKASSPLMTQACYHLGRLLSYLTLGLLAGFGGAYLDLAGEHVGIQKVTALLAGALLIIWGLRAFFAPSFLGKQASEGAVRKLLRQWFGEGIAQHGSQSQNAHSFFVGLLTILLPCGWLYMFVSVAAASAHPVHGALIMGVFWFGTVPILAVIGGSSARLTQIFGANLPRLSAGLIVIAGVFSLAGHVWPGTGLHSHHEHSHSNIEKTEIDHSHHH